MLFKDKNLSKRQTAEWNTSELNLARRYIWVSHITDLFLAPWFSISSYNDTSSPFSIDFKDASKRCLFYVVSGFFSYVPYVDVNLVQSLTLSNVTTGG